MRKCARAHTHVCLRCVYMAMTQHCREEWWLGQIHYSPRSNDKNVFRWNIFCFIYAVVCSNFLLVWAEMQKWMRTRMCLDLFVGWGVCRLLWFIDTKSKRCQNGQPRSRTGDILCLKAMNILQFRGNYMVHTSSRTQIKYSVLYNIKCYTFTTLIHIYQHQMHTL